MAVRQFVIERQTRPDWTSFREVRVHLEVKVKKSLQWDDRGGPLPQCSPGEKLRLLFLGSSPCPKTLAPTLYPPRPDACSGVCLSVGVCGAVQTCRLAVPSGRPSRWGRAHTRSPRSQIALYKVRVQMYVRVNRHHLGSSTWQRRASVSLGPRRWDRGHGAGR